VIRHAAAMVAWKTFRPGGTGGVAVYDYGSNQRRLLERVDNGGTLWLVTSTRRARQARRYHLAYKLADCAAIEPFHSLVSGRYRYVVRARDWRASRHFGFNDATSTLQRLRFMSGKPMADVGNPGLRLLSIPELTSGDVALLERLQHRIEHGRNVFMSYSHEDAAIASAIETELGDRDVSVSRDMTMLQPGQRWEDALREEVAGTDCFVVLVSPNSAAGTSYVHREVEWALAEHAVGGLVTTILPIVLAGGGWDKFPELHRFQRWDYPTRTTHPEGFDRLAEGIAATTRHAKGTAPGV
jgi:TIR domain